MDLASLLHLDDTPEFRKERSAFFTPPAITEFVAHWAIRSGDDRVMEPSAGDAAFLAAAVTRLTALRSHGSALPQVDGVEVHAHSALVARERVRQAGGQAHLRHSDFFDVASKPLYDVIIGNSDQAARYSRVAF